MITSITRGIHESATPKFWDKLPETFILKCSKLPLLTYMTKSLKLALDNLTHTGSLAMNKIWSLQIVAKQKQDFKGAFAFRYWLICGETSSFETY